MSDAVDLGPVDPARSRHAGRRSAVTLTDDALVAGTANGEIRAFDRDTLAARWQADAVAGSVVAACPFDDGVAVGERGAAGTVAVYDTDGTERWRYDTAADVGDPARETRFFLPFVASLATDGDSLYVASRRYERDGDSRVFESVVAAFDPDGTCRWRYETDASPISLSAAEGRVAVAYNRCPGDHPDGLVVLDESGSERWRWDPAGEGQRRVGDVSLFDGGLAVASHADYRGYVLSPDGTERWRTDLARPRSVGGETVYAYPNHVHATSAGVAFVTGNTYPEEGRETDARHPNEHTATGFGHDGTERWADTVGGFVGTIGVDDQRLAVPAAQHFRDPDAAVHACRVLDVEAGQPSVHETAGVVTAAALEGNQAVAIEEPVVYHDEGERHGQYRLHVWTS